MSGCDAADAHVGADPLPGRVLRTNVPRGGVVSPEPLRGEALDLLYVFDDVLIQSFIPDRAVIALDVSVLLGLSGLDILDRNPMFFCPFQQFSTIIFRAIINPNCSWFSTSFDDPVQAADDPFGRERKVELDAKPLTIKVV